jgi:hypothetical protein
LGGLRMIRFSPAVQVDFDLLVCCHHDVEEQIGRQLLFSYPLDTIFFALWTTSATCEPKPREILYLLNIPSNC